MSDLSRDVEPVPHLQMRLVVSYRQKMGTVVSIGTDATKQPVQGALAKLTFDHFLVRVK